MVEPAAGFTRFATVGKGTILSKCDECAAIVDDLDVEIHGRWHTEVARMYQVAVEAFLDPGTLADPPVD